MNLGRKLLPPLISGALFGAGLTIGGMTDPQRVRGFLDLFGRWDPTLAFVMGGALVVMSVAWRLRTRMRKPVLGTAFSLPDRTDLDARLVAGSALFGIGWGVAGLCPGPALANLAVRPVQAAPFIAAMIAGMLAHRFSENFSNTKESRSCKTSDLQLTSPSVSKSRRATWTPWQRSVSGRSSAIAPTGKPLTNRHSR